MSQPDATDMAAHMFSYICVSWYIFILPSTRSSFDRMQHKAVLLSTYLDSCESHRLGRICTVMEWGDLSRSNAPCCRLSECSRLCIRCVPVCYIVL
jgi:hypothetical protein